MAPVPGRSRKGLHPLTSACPPVVPRAGPDARIRGPGISPLLMASRRATSTYPSDPASRTVVNPASRVFFAFIVPYIAPCAGVSFSAARSPPSLSMEVRWVCASMKPGRSVCPDRSITRLPAGIRASFVGYDDHRVGEFSAITGNQAVGPNNLYRLGCEVQSYHA